MKSGMRNAECRKKSQRDFGPKPKVARHELPWVKDDLDFPNPNGVEACLSQTPRQPRWGWFDFLRLTQGNSFVVTLGWRTQSLWDWPHLRALSVFAFRFSP